MSFVENRLIWIPNWSFKNSGAGCLCTAI